ncbi:MAG TPA: hypothetical protein VNH15_06020 [Elusimicrobiota bacterium]|nr:hypothetical protein [Elusimicrobiota bacterium]
MKKTMAGLLIAVLAALVSVGGAAAAQGRWRKNHPRQAQALNRTRRQQRNANRLYKNGKISKRQRNKIVRNDRRMRREDRRMARRNGGYITKGQQRSLNRQENRNLGRMRRNAGGSGGSAAGQGAGSQAPSQPQAAQ